MIGSARLAKPWYVWRPWQLASRAQFAWRAPRAGYRPVHVAWGVSLLVDPQMAIGHSICTTGVHDLAVTEILARLIQPGDTVVDAGAHLGYTATLASVAAGRDGHVMAWEPHPELFRVLEQNFAQVAATHTQIARVTLRNAALGRAPGRASLVVPDENSRNDGTSRLDRTPTPPARSIPVAVDAIDDVVGAESVDVMKLDVEGSEIDVLTGAAQALRARRIRHIVFEDHQGPASDVVRLLQSAGYAVFAIGWSIRRPLLGRLDGRKLATAYEAPSYLATLAPDDVQGRCAKPGWLTLSGRFASRDAA